MRWEGKESRKQGSEENRAAEHGPIHDIKRRGAPPPKRTRKTIPAESIVDAKYLRPQDLESDERTRWTLAPSATLNSNAPQPPGAGEENDSVRRAQAFACDATPSTKRARDRSQTQNNDSE